MNKIRLLDNSTINKIAAGEVVERPSSVVKELVENAIDAKASAITVEIKDGGTTFIKITDNGTGIPYEDVKTAFLRHATSKITDAGDLDNIFSLGFRGEALASIAAVSKVEMLTKTRNSDAGTRIRINGGILEDIRFDGAANGTSITVEDIFYNVPARRKFLKKPSTEAGYVSDIVMKFVLGHPEISFKYINNGTVIIHTSGNSDLKTAVYHVYGKDTAFKMLDISGEMSEMKLDGLIGRPELSRANRSCENLFINGRFIKSPIVASAAEEAYKTRLMIGKFPIYALSMRVNPSMVDVNVHPTKLEVRFRDDDAVYNFIYNSIVNTLDKKVLIKGADWESKPSFTVKEYINPPETMKKAIQQELTGKLNLNEPMIKSESEHFVKFDRNVSDNDRRMAETLLKGGEAFRVRDNSVEYKKAEPVCGTYALQSEIAEKEAVIKEELKDIKTESFDVEKPFFDNYRIIGQIFGTYWIIEQGKSVFMIDQHAAHERILFEEFFEKYSCGKIISQNLIADEYLVLNDNEKEILKDNMELIEGFGFKLRENDGDYYLKSVPYIFDEPATAEYLRDIIDTVKSENIKNLYDRRLLNIATIACKAAVKGGDRLTFEEAEELIKKLLTLKNPFSCPHGRPTIIEMTEYELEKKFKRIQ